MVAVSGSAERSEGIAVETTAAQRRGARREVMAARVGVKTSLETRWEHGETCEESHSQAWTRAQSRYRAFWLYAPTDSRVSGNMLSIISSPIPEPDTTLREIALRVDRLKLAKRIWRGTAEDGREFGFELGRPLRHGDTFWQTADARYVIRQEEEAVLEIPLQMAPSAAAGVGWAVGNLHLELMSEPTRLLTPDDKAARQLLERIQIPYRETRAIFRPGRFARGEVAGNLQSRVDELGPSHKH